MAQDIASFLMRSGPSSAESIAKALDISQPTVSRMLQAHANKIVRSGGSKNTVYGLLRPVRQIKEALIPVIKIDEHGQSLPYGQLAPIYPEGYFWIKNKSQPSDEWPTEYPKKTYFQSLPYFIHDARHQGFMGRILGKQYAQMLGTPENTDHWNDDDILVAMTLLGEDLPGNLVVGETSYRRLKEKSHTAIYQADIGRSYNSLADLASTTGAPGSSAGGEFPKFSAYRIHENKAAHVIVKFSGKGGSQAEVRWADLLRSESHASQAIKDHLGVESANATIITDAGRAFLESVRFDRLGSEGRIGICSLAALDGELIGSSDQHWDKVANELLRLRMIDEKTCSDIHKIWVFGKLIANSDMHGGNLSFQLSEKGKLKVCPVYDMLPMRYAPLRGGEIPEIKIENKYEPIPGHETEYAIASESAKCFWESVTKDALISEAFRDIASHHLDLLVTKRPKP